MDAATKPFDVTAISDAEDPLHAFIRERSPKDARSSLRRPVTASNSRQDESPPRHDQEMAGESSEAGQSPVGQDTSGGIDFVNHPPHYTSHPSGVECITITEWMNFNVGNAVKYLWRAGEKGFEIQDLKKARWYIDREIARLEKLRDGK